jgi:hypothetical protein
MSISALFPFGLISTQMVLFISSMSRFLAGLIIGFIADWKYVSLKLAKIRVSFNKVFRGVCNLLPIRFE